MWGATGVRNWIVAAIIYNYEDIYCAIKLAAACFLYESVRYIYIIIHVIYNYCIAGKKTKQEHAHAIT